MAKHRAESETRSERIARERQERETLVTATEERYLLGDSWESDK